ncbi:MAG: putative porin [Betaproteobacteria bacterium]
MKFAARILLLASLCVCAGNAASQDAAADRQELEALRQTTMKLIELMVSSGIITQEKAEELLRDARRDAAKAASPPAAGESKQQIVRVPFVPRVVRDEIRDEVKQEVVAQAKQEGWGKPDPLPSWISGMKFDGEVKFRLQSNHLSGANAPVGTYADVQTTNTSGQLALQNTQGDSQLARVQFRLGVEAPIDDWVMAGARLTTGNLNSPVTEYQTLGSTFGRATIGLDRAYIKLDPLPWAKLWLGKFSNPWFSTDMVWYEDLSFEGIVAAFRYDLASGTTPFFTAGLLPLQGYDCTSLQILSCGNYKRLYAAQLGVEQKMIADSYFKIAGALYNFDGVQGQTNDPAFPTDKTFVPGFVQKGNSMFNVNPLGSPPLFGLASKFKELNLTARFDLGSFDPTRIALTVDYVKNIGFDRQEILQRTGLDLEPRTEGYQARLSVGRNEIIRRGDWQAWLGYKRIERDAVLDAFNDADFHLGGTDAKGWFVGGTYGIAKNTSVRLRYLSANEIDNPPLAIDVFQLDLTAKF